MKKTSGKLSLILLTLAVLSVVSAASPGGSTIQTIKSYPLTDCERTLIEEVVMAESGAEPYTGKLAVAQCILDAAVFEDISPAEVVAKYGYTSLRKTPSSDVKKAVSEVFDLGKRASSERMLYFYAPAFVTSNWHERQEFVAEIGNHRFFDSPR